VIILLVLVLVLVLEITEQKGTPGSTPKAFASGLIRKADRIKCFLTTDGHGVKPRGGDAAIRG
jgi:hypothetical protein